MEKLKARNDSLSQFSHSGKALKQSLGMRLRDIILVVANHSNDSYNGDDQWWLTVSSGKDGTQIL